MLTVTVKFVVKSQEEADNLMDEISEDVGNLYGVPYIHSSIDPSTEEEIKAYKEVTE